MERQATHVAVVETVYTRLSSGERYPNCGFKSRLRHRPTNQGTKMKCTMKGCIRPQELDNCEQCYHGFCIDHLCNHGELESCRRNRECSVKDCKKYNCIEMVCGDYYCEEHHTPDQHDERVDTCATCSNPVEYQCTCVYNKTPWRLCARCMEMHVDVEKVKHNSRVGVHPICVGCGVATTLKCKKCKDPLCLNNYPEKCACSCFRVQTKEPEQKDPIKCHISGCDNAIECKCSCGENESVLSWCFKHYKEHLAYNPMCGPIRDKPSPTTIDHPPHYNQGKLEAIVVIEDWKLGFCLGNAVKYICRAGHKEDTDRKQDLEKALWYLQREIDYGV